MGRAKLRNMERKTFWRRGRRIAPVLVPLLAVVGFWLYPPSQERCLRGIALVEVDECYELPLGPGDTLFFKSARADAGLDGASMRRDSSLGRRQATGFFISPSGCLVTDAAVWGEESVCLASDTLRICLRAEEARLARLRRVVSGQLEELAYYKRTHTVIDDGYNPVMDYYEHLHRRILRLDTLWKAVQRAMRLERPEATLRRRAAVRYAAPLTDEPGAAAPASSAPNDADEALAAAESRACRATADAVWPCRLERLDSGGLALFRLEAGVLPAGAYRFRPSRFWGLWPVSPRRNVALLGYPYYKLPAEADSLRPVALSLRVQKGRFSLSPFPLSAGAPVRGVLGRVVGVNAGGRFVPVADVCRLRGEYAPFWRRWADNVQAWWCGSERKQTRRDDETI